MRLKCNAAAFHIKKLIRTGTQTRLSRERGNVAETTCFLARLMPLALPSILPPTRSPSGCVAAPAQALVHPVVPSQPDPRGHAPEQRRLVASNETFYESRCHSRASSQPRSWLQAEAGRATSSGRTPPHPHPHPHSRVISFSGADLLLATRTNVAQGVSRERVGGLRYAQVG